LQEKAAAHQHQNQQAAETKGAPPPAGLFELDLLTAVDGVLKLAMVEPQIDL
jgi:hypothetical protein